MKSFFFIFLSPAAFTFELPSEWSTMPDSDNLSVVPVNSGSPDYTNVMNRFHREVGRREIVKVRVAS